MPPKMQAKETLERSINIPFQLPKIGRSTLILFIVIFVFVLAVLQDYIYSQLQGTGFYLSESMLYNVFWALFLPLTLGINRLIYTINPKNELIKLPFNLCIGIAWGFLHVLLFASLFVLVSSFVLTPAHRFSHIFNTALSNQLSIALIWYTVFPCIYISKEKSNNTTKNYTENIKLKNGTMISSIATSTIQLIHTDKPYSIIHTSDQKYLDSKSLKAYEKMLDPAQFLRVHRSAIINRNYLQTLTSRSNGDYDAKLKNGRTTRLSRHYRKNWEQLLH